MGRMEKNNHENNNPKIKMKSLEIKKLKQIGIINQMNRLTMNHNGSSQTPKEFSVSARQSLLNYHDHTMTTQSAGAEPIEPKDSKPPGLAQDNFGS
jgi:hypothetical protein